jgi:nitrogen fixation NifU-like protein
MEDLYLEHILDHYEHPRNKVTLTNQKHVCSLTNHGCGDEISVVVESSKNRLIKKVLWDGTGCAISQASASILSGQFVGMPVSEIALWDKEQVEKALGIELSPAREKCALLFVRAVQKSLL